MEGNFPHGSGYTSSPITKSFTYDEEVTFAATYGDDALVYLESTGHPYYKPYRQGYVFNGWRITSGSGTVYTKYGSDWNKVDGSIEYYYWTFDGKCETNVTVKAQWLPTVAITLNDDEVPYVVGNSMQATISAANGVAVSTLYYKIDSGSWSSSSSNPVNVSLSSCAFGSHTLYAYVRDSSGNTGSTNSKTFTVSAAVAQIGSTYYASLDDAIGAVPATNTKTTITMLANEKQSEHHIISTGKNIVIDLNGKDIETTGGSTIVNRGSIVTLTGEGCIRTYKNYGVYNEAGYGYPETTVGKNITVVSEDASAIKVETGKLTINNGAWIMAKYIEGKKHFAVYAIASEDGKGGDAVLEIKGRNFLCFE